MPYSTIVTSADSKVGILTFHRAYNYGAILQAFALQNAMQQLGVESEIVDYISLSRKQRQKLFSFRKDMSLKDKCKNVFKDVYRLKKRRKFDRFIKRYMKISPAAYHDSEQLRELDKSGTYGAYVVGSDQVWNADITQDDPAYLLSFANSNDKRNSYAASIGSCRFDAEREATFLRELRTFRVLTVREKSALESYPFLKECGAEVVLDPTLLLTKEEYAAIASKRRTKRKYAFLYTVPQADQLRRFAKDYCQKQGWVLIDIKKSMRAFLHSAPEDWLSFILNAEMVFTNSFHGTAFSIIMEKQFVTEADTSVMKNVRALDLLALTGLQSRDMSSAAFRPQDTIDYGAVRSRLAAAREKSFAILKEIAWHE